MNGLIQICRVIVGVSVKRILNIKLQINSRITQWKRCTTILLCQVNKSLIPLILNNDSTTNKVIRSM